MVNEKKVYDVLSNPEKYKKIAIVGLIAIVVIFYVSSTITYKNPSVQ
jgi:hypothetical protein